MQQHNYTLYGMRVFKDMQNVLFLKDVLSEGNIYNLFIANVTRDKPVQKGKVYLCHLTDSDFISKDDESRKLYHLFLLPENDPNILLLERRSKYLSLKESKLSEINPYEHNAILDFKVVCIKEATDLYRNTQILHSEIAQ